MYHLKCRPGDIAENVLVSGDPGRSSRIAELLEGARLVNGNRGLLTYTGYYNGRRVTVSTTGMGAPSAAIVMEELAALGAKKVIRVGTTGAIRSDVELGDLIVPVEAVPLDGATRAYAGPEAVKADGAIVEELRSRIETEGLRFHLGRICTSDTFYLEEEKGARDWASRGVLSFEMECSVIFALGKLRGYRAGAVLTVTGKVSSAGDRIIDDSTTQRSIERSIVCALDVIALGRRA